MGLAKNGLNGEMVLIWGGLKSEILLSVHSIKSSLGEWQPDCGIDRKEEVTLARLRIGHTFITYSFLLKGEDWSLCIPCQEPFSVKHFLLDCTDFRIIYVQDSTESVV